MYKGDNMDHKAFASFGLDQNWVNAFLAKFGPEALGIVLAALQGNLSVDTCLDVINTLGIDALKILVGLVGAKNSSK